MKTIIRCLRALSGLMLALFLNPVAATIDAEPSRHVQAMTEAPWGVAWETTALTDLSRATPSPSSALLTAPQWAAVPTRLSSTSFIVKPVTPMRSIPIPAAILLFGPAAASLWGVMQWAKNKRKS